MESVCFIISLKETSLSLDEVCCLNCPLLSPLEENSLEDINNTVLSVLRFCILGHQYGVLLRKGTTAPISSPEPARICILGADQKECSLWERDCDSTGKTAKRQIHDRCILCIISENVHIALSKKSVARVRNFDDNPTLSSSIVTNILSF